MPFFFFENKQFAFETWKMFQEKRMLRKETGGGNEGNTQDKHCPLNSSAQLDFTNSA